MFQCVLTDTEGNMATNVYSPDLRWHTNALTRMAVSAAGQNKYVPPESNVLFERLAPQCVFQKSYMSSDQDDDLCFDNDIDSVTDREFSESAATPSITYLNANTNGAVAKDVRAGATRNKTEEAGLRALSVGETEIQLDAVGLSLSGSGMHLYVKADTDEKKKLLADTYVQLTAKPMKEKASRNLNVMKLLPLSSDNLETEGYLHKVINKGPQDNATYWKDTPRYDKQAVQVLRAYDQPMEQPSLLNSSPQAHVACTRLCRGYAQCEDTYAPIHTALPARGEINRHAGSKKIMPMLDKFHSQEMVVNNNKDYQRDLTYENKKHNYQQIHSHTFDTLKRQNEDEIGANHQEKRSRYTDPQVYRKQQQLILLHNQNHSSNNDDFIVYETGRENGKDGMKMKMITSPLLCQRNDNNHGTCMVNNELSCNNASIQTVMEPTYSGLTKQVSPNLFPHATCSSSTAYNGVSMSNFIDYTNNIRKSIKEDYRNLSKLIKEFSDEIQERFNNGDSQSEPDKPRKDRQTKRSSENCLLM